MQNQTQTTTCLGSGRCKKGAQLTPKHYFWLSKHGLDQGFLSSSCSLLFGLGCKIAFSAALLSVPVERAEGEMKEKKLAANLEDSKWGASVLQSCCTKVDLSKLGIWGELLSSTLSTWIECSRWLRLLPALLRASNTTKLGRKPGGTTIRCQVLYLFTSSQKLWNWYSCIIHHRSSVQDLSWVDMSKGTVHLGNSFSMEWFSSELCSS